MTSLKLVRTNLNYRKALGTSIAAIFFQIIILSMHLLSRMNVMLDFIYMGPVDLPWAHRKWQYTKWKKFLTTVGLEPTTLRFLAWCSTDCAILLKSVIYTYMYLLKHFGMTLFGQFRYNMCEFPSKNVTWKCILQ